MKAKWKSLTALGLAAVMAGGLVGCGGISSDKLTFLVYGDNSEVAMYKKMAQEFNRTYGAENGIEVETVPVSVEGYANYVRSMATAKNSYDVFFADESNFKAYVQAHCAADISEELQAVTDIDTSDVFKTTVDRLRFNPATNTSNENDSLYGMPLDTGTASDVIRMYKYRLLPDLMDCGGRYNRRILPYNRDYGLQYYP